MPASPAPKPAEHSLTVRALALAAVPVLSHLTGLGAEVLTETLGDLITLAGLALAIYGRHRATGPLVWPWNR